MSERNFGRGESEFKQVEDLDKVGLKKLEDFKNTPWQDISDDLEAFSNPKILANPEAHHIFINNETAKNAVEEGWLVVKKVAEGKYEAFTTADWEEEKGRMKRSEAAAREFQKKSREITGRPGGNGNESKRAAEASPLIKLLEENKEGGLYDLEGNNGQWELTIYRKKDKKSQRKNDGKKLQDIPVATFKGSIQEIIEEFTERYLKF